VSGTCSRCARWLRVLVWYASLLPAAVPAQPAAPITGRVTDRGDGSPVAGAEVRHEPSGRRVRSATDGSFRVEGRPGDSVTVRALGFRAVTQVVTGEPLVVALDVLPTVLPGVTTTVGQRALRAGESARHVTLLGREALEGSAAIAVNQALRLLPGVQELPSAPSRTTLALRGFDDARVLVLVDGEPVPGALLERRDIGRVSSVGAERIEVTKGPGSVEFGSDAIGGVINIVRAAPSQTLMSDWLVRQGGMGRREATGSLSDTRGRVGVRVDGGWRQVDRLPGYDAASTTFQRVYDLRTDWRVALPRAWALRLDLQGAQERQRFPVDARFNGFIDNRSATGFLEAAGPLAGGRLRLRGSGIHYAYQYRQARGLLPIRGSADSLEQLEQQARALAAWTRQIGQHGIDMGVQTTWRALEAPGRLDGLSAGERVLEAFARDAWTRDRWQLSVGGRYTGSSLWGQAWNPSVGLVLQAAPTWRVRSAVARGFRAPGFKEIRYTFFNPAGGYVLAGNPLLRPEVAWSTSAGVTWAPHSAVTVDVEAFRTDVRDLIDWRFLGNTPGGYQQYANVNIARARSQGLETTLRGRLAGTDITLGHEFLHARNRLTGLPLGRRAAHTTRLHAARTWGVRNGLTSDLSLRHATAAPLIGVPSGAPITSPFATDAGITGEQGAFLSVDLQLRLQVTPTLEWSAGGVNLLDQRPAGWTPAFARQLQTGVRFSPGGR